MMATRWLRLVAPAGAIVLVLLAAALAPVPALAADNVVRIEPSGIEVAPGGSFTVKLIDDPTPESTAIWAIDVAYDPGVVSTESAKCKSMNTPPGAIGAFDCQVVDADKDGAPDTVKVLGVVLFTGTQTGLVNETTLADITFDVVGDPGACTDLHLRIRSHADKEGQETGALVQDGRACIRADAPPTGTASPVPFTPRTSEPTETPSPGPGGNPSTPSDGQQSVSPDQTRRSDSPGGGGGSESPGGGSGTPGVGGGGETTDDDGTSPLVWVGAAGIVAVLAAGAAWAIIRLRSSRPPEEPPPS